MNENTGQKKLSLDNVPELDIVEWICDECYYIEIEGPFTPKFRCPHCASYEWHIINKLIDLSDERRQNKPWLPIDDRDVTNGLVILGSDNKPECIRHGAMNRVDKFRSLWRCSEFRCGVGAEII